MMFAGTEMIPVTNRSLELSDCTGSWFFNKAYECWCLEDILYTDRASVPRFQRLSVYAPKAYMNPDGTPDRTAACGKYTAETAPVVFANNAAGYMQML